MSRSVVVCAKKGKEALGAGTEGAKTELQKGSQREQEPHLQGFEEYEYRLWTFYCGRSLKALNGGLP